MAGTARPFHGLSGGEIRTMLVQEMTAQMAQHPDFGTDQPVAADWTYRCVFEVGDPRTPQTFEVACSGADQAANGPALRQVLAASLGTALTRDQRLAQHLSFPRVSWSPRLTLTFKAPTSVLGADSDRESVVKARQTGTEAGLLAKREREIVGSDTSAPAFVVGPDGRRYQLVPVEASMPVDAAPSVAVGHTAQPTEPAKPPLQFRTGTGLEITGGAAHPDMPAEAAVRSFGGGSLAGVVHAESVSRSIELGVRHPRLEDGGIKPDQARRDNGLPVPQPQKTASGNIVDLPATSF